MEVINTLAYYDTATITALKKFNSIGSWCLLETVIILYIWVFLLNAASDTVTSTDLIEGFSFFTEFKSGRQKVQRLPK
jgi:hypothetical protein